jgi:hypothetical protein
MLPKALDILNTELSGAKPLAAAVSVFRLAGLERIGAPGGPTDADEQIERMAKARRPDPFASIGSHNEPVSDRERANVIAEIEQNLAAE